MSPMDNRTSAVFRIYRWTEFLTATKTTMPLLIRNVPRVYLSGGYGIVELDGELNNFLTIRLISQVVTDHARDECEEQR